MRLHAPFYLALSVEEAEILRQCMRIAIQDGSILGGCDPDHQSVIHRARTVYELAGKIDRLIPKEAPRDGSLP